MAQKRTAPAPAVKALAMLKTYGRCAYCGKKLGDENLTFDHIIPYSQGGQNSIDNLYPACQACNQMRGNKSIEEFRKELQEGLKTAAEKMKISGTSARDIMLKSYMSIDIKIKPVIFFFEKLDKCQKTTQSFEEALDKIAAYEFRKTK